MTSSRTFDDLVSQYSPSVQALAAAARRFIRRAVPGLDERVDASGPYIGYGYGTGYKGMVCTLILSKAAVKVGVAGGATLPDPNDLLRGTGKVHRYIDVRRASDLTRPGVRELVEAAAQESRARIQAAPPAQARRTPAVRKGGR